MLTKEMGSLVLNEKKKVEPKKTKETTTTTTSEKKETLKNPAPTAGETEKNNNNIKKKDEKKDEKKAIKKLRANAPEFKLKASAPAFVPGGFRQVAAPRPPMQPQAGYRPRGYPPMQGGMMMQGGMPINPTTGKPMTFQELQFVQQQQYAAMIAQQQRNARP